MKIRSFVSLCSVGVIFAYGAVRLSHDRILFAALFECNFQKTEGYTMAFRKIEIKTGAIGFCSLLIASPGVRMS